MLQGDYLMFVTSCDGIYVAMGTGRLGNLRSFNTLNEQQTIIATLHERPTRSFPVILRVLL